MWLYYKLLLGKSYAIFHLPRIIKNLVLFPLESVLLILFLAAVMPFWAAGWAFCMTAGNVCS